MIRKIPELGRKLEALLDERDDLLIRISLEQDAFPPNAARLEAMHSRVAQLEIEIRQNRAERGANQPAANAPFRRRNSRHTGSKRSFPSRDPRPHHRCRAAHRAGHSSSRRNV